MESSDKVSVSAVDPITLQVKVDGVEKGHLLDLGLGEVLMRLTPPSKLFDSLGSDPVKITYRGHVTCSSCGTEDSPRYSTSEGLLWAITVCREEGFVWQKYPMEMH